MLNKFDNDLSAKISVIILKTAMTLILAVMGAGFILYLAGNGRLAASLHSAALDIILFAPLAVATALTVIFSARRQFFMGLLGVLLLLLLVSDIVREALGA
ncbi:MAG: hypothetical protein LBD73_05225 [Deferribacteraceae bacterium]|jgi:hypothetical protein|nr:hypothetical protein [Deferribacteraceae bacterium]